MLDVGVKMISLHRPHALSLTAIWLPDGSNRRMIVSPLQPQPVEMLTVGDGVDDVRDGSTNGHALYCVVASLVVVVKAKGGHTKGRQCVDPTAAYRP